MYLENINSINDFKNLDKKALPSLAEEIRSYIVEIVSANGGHLASNLGVVDLTLVLHYLFNSPKDSFIFDVGHQAYTHKILTGRRNNFHTLRSYEGISGFPKRHESIHDIEETGHASTSLSFALGMAVARKKQNIDGDVIAIIGDGAMTGGIALEAINNISHTDSDIIVIVNNNEMSIGNNIGAISKTFNMAFNDSIVQEISSKIKDVVGIVPFGYVAKDIIKRLEGAIRSFVAPGIIFRELGFKYFGPVNGHNYEELFSTFEKVKESKGPRMIQVNTVKGKGYHYAEKNPAKFHGVAPFIIETGELKSKSSKTFSSLAGECIVETAKYNDKVVAITAAMESGTGLSDFAKLYPNRFFDVGIAEQHATTFAVGLAEAGLIPFIALYSTFLQRAFDQVIHDVGIMNANVKFMIDRAGLVPDDGDTHQGVFDTAFLRIIPNIRILSPVGEKDFRLMVKYAEETKGPIVIRYAKENVVKISENIVPNKIEEGKSHIVKNGKNGIIISYGSIINTIENVLTDNNFDIALLNLVFLKPLDEEKICSLAKNYDKILIIEEAVSSGGIGEAVLSVLSKNNIEKHLKIHAIENKFIEVATRKKLLEIYKLDYNGINETIKEFFS